MTMKKSDGVRDIMVGYAKFLTRVANNEGLKYWHGEVYVEGGATYTVTVRRRVGRDTRGAKQDA